MAPLREPTADPGPEPDDERDGEPNAAVAADPRVVSDAEPPARRAGLAPRLTRLDLAALVPAALALFFSSQAGGFFPGSTGVAACVLAIVLALRITLAQRPFASVGPAATVVAAALAAYLAWTLLSASWSNSAGRALLEFNRTLLYTLAFLLCASFAWRGPRLALAVRALAVAIFAVCLVGWLSRTFPELVASTPGAVPERLSHPLTYWNAMGLACGLGLLLATHLACSTKEPDWVRALGAGAVPLLGSALLLTFSRGAILATAVGLVAYVLLLRSRALVLGGLAVLPPAAMGLLVTYDADVLVTKGPTGGAVAIAQGQDVAIAVALCVLAGVVARVAVTRWLEPRVKRAALGPRARVPARIAAVGVALVVLVVLPLALGAPGYAQRTFERFVEGNQFQAKDPRDRLVTPANNGRIDHWRVGIDTWRERPVLGSGAGTFANRWNEERDLDLNVRDAHSLYVEVLSELGLVGFVILLAALGTALVATVRRAHRRRRARGIDPSLDAVVVAILIAWGVHAGLDWIWELPALTAWVFALAGLALAVRVEPTAPSSPGRSVRVALGIGCLVVAVLPFQVARSQQGLDSAVRAFRASPQDCPKAIDRSLASLDAVGARPEGWEIIAYCDVGAGQPKLAVNAARNAVARDPENWTYRYALALVQGVAGEDPRPAARRALVLNPKSELAQDAVARFGKAPRRRWAQVARALPLPSS